MEQDTTTDKIAEFAEVSRKAVNQLLRHDIKDLEQFERWNLKWSSYAEVEQASASKMRVWNEQQATLLSPICKTRRQCADSKTVRE